MENSKPSSALDVWRKINQTPDIVNFFQGIFDVIGIIIEETNEELTIAVGDTEVNIDPGLPENPDFIVPLKWENVENMISHAKDGKIDSFETWRIVSVLFTSLTQSTLKNPMMSNNLLRIFARVEDLAHVHLIAPNGDEVTSHSLIYVKKQWLVIPGTHGKPKRTFKMTAEDSIEYQRKVFYAIKKNNIIEWMKFSSWYSSWRKTVSVKH
ncbi:MAG: hypothetical protein VW394_01575 [Candidatus Heimdallarchaeota archaeon]|jgi:hypothetical protein